ncbi:hypothetical protein [Rhodovulum marinum]|uniref:Uncharacterized protein n=1 Tax=Rhodovulum marinum TaxID=320662 RepID=A0A4R2Q5K3_9RHOB|nr:hypothetical protein [Rhodovulum marinum]TCP43930.1 hypothetical protein EV662_10113 [Rhodovulum marinum]
MPVQFPAGYALPAGDKPLTHARIAHAGNWITGTITASSTDAAAIYTAEAPANSLLFERWKPAEDYATWEIATSSASAVDYCVVAAHDLAAAGAWLFVEFFDGAGWRECIPGFQVSGAGPLFVMFPPIVADRFRVGVWVEAGATRPAIGFIRFGKALQMEERTTYVGRTPFELARQVTMTGNRSVRGEFLSRVKLRAGLPLSFRWAFLSESFVQTEAKAFLDAIEADLFVIADRPGTHPDDVALCWTQSARPRPSAAGAMDLHNLEIDAEGYLSDA